MYQNSFYITNCVGNNALSYEQRTNKKLFVPSLKTILSFDQIQITPSQPSNLTPTLSYKEREQEDHKKRISKIWEEWLPQSGYVARTTPAFAKYTKNQFLADDDCFELVFYLPIGF